MKFSYVSFIFISLLSLLTSSPGWTGDNQSGGPLNIVVYRSPTCQCCKKWVDHLKQNNFNTQEIVTDDVQAIKDKYGVPKEMASCHTALINGYVIEGHVPASDIANFIKSKPKLTGIAVPGMPKGSPGMEGSGGKDPYDVVSFDRDNKFKVIHRYNQQH